MKEQITVRIDNETKELLKKQTGKKLQKIGYVNEKDFSLATILVFEDITIEICNTAKAVGVFHYEYPHISAKAVKIKNDIAYDNEKYEYFDVNMTITGYYSLIDYISWPKDNFFDIENAIIIEGNDGKIIMLYAIDTGAEAIAVFTDKDVFEKENPIEELWPIDRKNVFYKRTYKKLM